eukprot:3255994-Pyramimonas_sp.AAC.1
METQRANMGCAMAMSSFMSRVMRPQRAPDPLPGGIHVDSCRANVDFISTGAIFLGTRGFLP